MLMGKQGARVKPEHSVPNGGGRERTEGTEGIYNLIEQQYLKELEVALK